MPDWIGRIDSLLSELDKNVRDATRAVRSAFGDGPFEVLCYRGYGNATHAQVFGRAQEHRGVGPSSADDGTLENLFNTYRRADSNPLRLAEVAVEYVKHTKIVKADDEGFFNAQVELLAPITTDDAWSDYAVDLLAPARPGMDRPRGKGEIRVPQQSARFGVISDIDDTVIQSHVSNFLQAARTVMLGNARTRLPFPGVAGFYQALEEGASGKEMNPIFYVSSSPWNIYDVITEFMDHQKIPRGPVLLRDWDIGIGALASTRHFDHKGVAIRNIMTMYPDLPFILIGDTSQHDPEIYRRIVEEFPNRVQAIYIRDVTRNEARSHAVQKLAEEVLAAKSTLVLAEDTLGAAKHAVEQGWISADALERVREEKRADTGQDGSKVATPDGGKPSTGEPPTVIE
jgi:phosphatidate phosphatase APP1